MINILVATYNGEAFLRDQLDSILSQTVQDFKLIISDDGSSDRTKDIILEYKAKYPDKVVLYNSGIRFGSAGAHFLDMLKNYPDAKYVMFCDQDDVWHPNKIERTLSLMQQMEKENGGAVLIHSDLKVVDANLCTIDPSYIHMMDLDVSRINLQQVLVQTVATGCTMMINKELAKEVILHLPKEELRGHDSWITRVAALIGSIGFVDETLIDYRQHANNTIGAEHISFVNHVKRYILSGRKLLFETFSVADILLECYGNVIPDEKKEILKIYSSLQNANPIKRKYCYIKYGFLKNQRLKRIAQILFE